MCGIAERGPAVRAVSPRVVAGPAMSARPPRRA